MKIKKSEGHTVSHDPGRDHERAIEGMRSGVDHLEKGLDDIFFSASLTIRRLAGNDPRLADRYAHSVPVKGKLSRKKVHDCHHPLWGRISCAADFFDVGV
jgi:hypothetical protein